MNTRKPFATISYNSEEFLAEVLGALYDSDIIEFYAYIWHQPEEDERKGHFHVYMVPAKQLNTKSLQHNFEEIVLGEEKPRGIMPCQSSKFGDWALYIIHDPSYLASKGQSRKYHYTFGAVKTSDADFFQEQVRNINSLALTPYQTIEDCIKQGMNFEDFLRVRQPNINSVNAFKSIWLSMISTETNRNGRPHHEPTDDQIITQEDNSVKEN